jgi:phospholipase C
MLRSHIGRRSAVGAAVLTATLTALMAGPGVGTSVAAPPPDTATPIQHLVVIFQENVSFDHYFGTYPQAANTGGQSFTAAFGTPSVDGLTSSLLTANPNHQVDAAGNTLPAAANPRRYDPTNVHDVLTCDQDHNYTDEQKAFDNGAMDKFPQTVGNRTSTIPGSTTQKCNANDVMNYYDGNSVTALWNYAQRYSMSDNSYSTTFGPSAPGAINLVSGNTGGVDMTHKVGNVTSGVNSDVVGDGQGGASLTGDAQPYWDDCSTRDAVGMSGTNIGDELNSAGLSWGWFQGGFRPTTSFADAAAATGNAGQSTATFTPDQFKGKFANAALHQSDQGICNALHPIGVGLPASLGTGNGQYGYKDDYIPHHEPFQYYASTANPHHLTLPTDGNGDVPTSALRTIGSDSQHYVGGQPQFDTPNHQYDMSDFDQLVGAIGSGDLPPSALPAVSFLKAPGIQDGHAQYSDPLDEQQYVVNEINALQKTPDWKSTAVVIAYDDSDGWYDHAYSGVSNPSQTVADALTGTGLCGTGTPVAGQQGRCGYGPRQPLLVISPWSRSNAVDHTLTDQSSITRFVEDNWGLGRIPGSMDAKAGTLDGLFDFGAKKGNGNAYGNAPNAAPFLLDPVTGQPQG